MKTLEKTETLSPEESVHLDEDGRKWRNDFRKQKRWSWRKNADRIDEKHNEAAYHPLNNTICQDELPFRANSAILLNLQRRLYGASRACTCWTLHLLVPAIPGKHTSPSLMPKHNSDSIFCLLGALQTSGGVLLGICLVSTHTLILSRYVARRKTTSA